MKEKTENLLATTNKLLIGIIVLLAIGVFFQMLTYFNVWDLKDFIYNGVNAIYDRIGRMRVY